MQLRRTLSISSIILTAVPVYLALSGVASAGTITAQGNVTALDDITQVTSITGSALFDEMFQGVIPADQYAGMTFHTGMFAEINPLILEMGEVPDPRWTSPGVHFPDPIAGGGVQNGYICQAGGAVTFADPITQFGLTAGGSHALYITAWDANFVIIGQVTWQPEEGDSAFVGIDTMGVPIGFLTVGNDDIVAGDPYDDQGAFAQSDGWMWGVAAPCAAETDCFDDGWSCIAHACDAGACTYSYTTEPCNDDDACTETDTCAEGLCVGAEVECADTEICTFDRCHVQDGCSNVPIEGCCHADEDCPENFECVLSSNTCVELPPPPPPPPPDETDSGGEESGDDNETTGTVTDEGGGGGCSCSTRDRGGPAALLGLFALVLVGGSRRRR
jgi:MYXO-CTERM domain-containing protein